MAKAAVHSQGVCIIWKKLSNLGALGSWHRQGFPIRRLGGCNWLISLQHKRWELVIRPKSCGAGEYLCLWPASRTTPASAQIPSCLPFFSLVCCLPLTPLLEVMGNEIAFLNSSIYGDF